MPEPSHNPPPSEQAQSDAASATRVTVLGAVGNAALSAIKGGVGITAGSSALIADAIHSLSDLLSDLVVFVSIRVAARPADAGHPYGHGRFETMGTVILAVLLLAAAGGMAVDSINHFGSDNVPAMPAMWAAGLSIVLKELLYRVTVRVGRKQSSPIIIANAWHHRTDAASSVAALAGIAGARLGFPILDPVAGVLIALLIAKVSVVLLRDAIYEVTDTSLEREMLDELPTSLQAISGVENIHELRARRMGHSVLVDLHVQVDGATTVSDGHQVAERVRLFLLDRYPAVSEVLVHIDPEPDQQDRAAPARPRAELELEVRRLAAEINGIEEVTHVLAHYLRGHVGVQIHMVVSPEITVSEASRIAIRLREAVEISPDIDNADVHLELEDGAHTELPRELEPLRPTASGRLRREGGQ